MPINFIRLTGNSTYKISNLLGTKQLTRLWLGFSHFSEHRFRQNFSDSRNPLCSCSIEPALHFFLRCQNDTNLRRGFGIELKNINDAIMSLNENDLLHVTIYSNKNFENNMNIRILTATIEFIKDSERLDQHLFYPILKLFLFHSLFRLFVQEVRYINN